VIYIIALHIAKNIFTTKLHTSAQGMTQLTDLIKCILLILIHQLDEGLANCIAEGAAYGLCFAVSYYRANVGWKNME
jgi:hypothetical protein